MVNEHYAQRSYLRLFSPANEGVISRYSLVEKHGGGDYYDPIDRFSVEKAASSENYADGLFESNETTQAEKAMVESLRKMDNERDLSEGDIANISQFIIFVRVYPEVSTTGTVCSREIISLSWTTRVSSSYGLRPCWRHVASRDKIVS